MKYVKVEWPEIQDYMGNPDYPEECFFDPEKNVWFIPEWWESEKELENEFNEKIWLIIKFIQTVHVELMVMED